MQTKRVKNKKYVLLIVGILFISLVFNVIVSKKNSDYQYRIGVVSYNNIENIRNKNESNIELLNSVIDVGVIDNMDLLKLYLYYRSISDSFINLWDEYSFYEVNTRSIIPNKKIETNKALINDVNGNIEEYFKVILENEMKTNTEKYVITEDTLDKFYKMKELSMDICDYYNNFCKSELDGATDDDKKDKIIKKVYWVDMLEGMNSINEKYNDIDFSIQ